MFCWTCGGDMDAPDHAEHCDEVAESAAFARATDPETSHEAAARVDVNRLEGLVLRMLKCVPDNAGLTTWEIADRLDLHAGSITPRMVQLERKGRVEPSTETRVAPGHRSRQIVWRLADEQKAS